MKSVKKRESRSVEGIGVGYIWEENKVKALVTMIISLSTVWLFGLIVSYVDGRLPPKFLKATNNVGKALYAGRYGYSMAPIPPKIVLQANLARKEVHLPLRTLRRKRRPVRHPDYASKYQDYTPAPPKKKRMRRPIKHRPKPRPPYRDPDYYEQDVYEEPEDVDYDFDERPSRFADDDFIAQHSELYANGYNNKKRPHRDEEPDETIHVYPRKPKPTVKSWTTVIRPVSKLYPSGAGVQLRPIIPRDEDYYRYEEEDDPPPPPPRQRIREKKKRLRPIQENDDRYEQRYPDKHKSRPEDHEYSPVSLKDYHDRAYEQKQKRIQRGTENKERGQVIIVRPRDEEEVDQRGRETHEIQHTKWSPIDDSFEPTQGPAPNIHWKDEPELTSPASDWRPELARNPQSEKSRETVPRLSPSQQPNESKPLWPDYASPQWPSLEEQLKPFKWVEPTASGPNTKPPRFTPEPNPTRVSPEPSTPRFSAKKRKTQKKPNEGETVAHRVVGGTLKWDSNRITPQHWGIQAYNQGTKPEGVRNAPSWKTETTKSQDTKSLNDSDIVYGSRQMARRREQDIGFGQGMETVDDKVAGWQVYK